MALILLHKPYQNPRLISKLETNVTARRPYSPLFLAKERRYVRRNNVRCSVVPPIRYLHMVSVCDK